MEAEDYSYGWPTIREGWGGILAEQGAQVINHEQREGMYVIS